jgi:hypothetical protein
MVKDDFGLADGAEQWFVTVRDNHNKKRQFLGFLYIVAM